MPNRLPIGPYRSVKLNSGQECPFYIIPFEKNGLCMGPQTRTDLIESAKEKGFTDIFVFSHGWNNDWSVATERYEHFLKGYMNLKQQYNLPVSPNYRPLLVGIFWPSTALVFTESEKGPLIAAGDPQVMDDAVSEQLHDLTIIGEEVASEAAPRFFQLAQKPEIGKAEALELATILRDLFHLKDDELGISESLTSEDIVSLWVPEKSEPSLQGKWGKKSEMISSDPQAAFGGGFLKKLDPRNIIRVATVWKMKDRAGKIGAKGVGPLLRDLLDVSQANIHAIGHSYGAKVMLSATSYGQNFPRRLDSMLLLQPAVSHLSFAELIPELGRSGGYRSTLERVTKPIFATFSKHDFPLRKLFHHFVRRKRDLGEIRIAGPESSPPNPYAALGGYGPRLCNEELINIQSANNGYKIPPDVRVVGLQADEYIKGHGDISNEATWWTLYNLSTSNI